MCKHRMAVILTGMAVLTLAGVAQAGVTFEYLGAFDTSGTSMAYGGGTGIAYNPDGDGGKGSFYVIGTGSGTWLGEFTKPAPKIDALGNLNVATTLMSVSGSNPPRTAATIGFGASGLEYVPPFGTQTTPRIFGTRSTTTTSMNIGYMEADGSSGVAWDLASSDDRRVGNSLTSVPASWVSANLPGAGYRFLTCGGGAYISYGPSIVAVQATLDNGDPHAPGASPPTTPLVWYTSASNLAASSSANWAALAWVSVAGQDLLVVGGRNDIDGDSVLESILMLYDPADLAAVAQGQMQPYEPRPIQVMDLSDRMLNNDYVRGADYDPIQSRLYLMENGPSGRPIVHVYQVTPEGGTSPWLKVTPESLHFAALSVEAVPAPQAAQVTNTAGGTLAWTATIRAPAPAWLSLTNASGGDGASFQVHADHRGLPAGSYVALVDVADPNAINTPQTLAVTLEVTAQDADISLANGYDDAWQTGLDGWVVAMRQVRRDWTNKTDGFVVLLGDSITYANPFGQWTRAGAGRSETDIAVCNWMHASDWGSGTNDSSNGWYLAAWDVPGRNGSFTARSGIRADQYVAGTYSLPSIDQMFTAGQTNPDGEQYRDAQMAVVLLGTNDAGANRAAAAVAADLGTICDTLLAAKVIPILTTIPPRNSDMGDVQTYNTAIRALAQEKALPLIDFCSEVLRRRPNDTWLNTLIASDGVHPSSSGGGYNTMSNPYATDGEALSHVGYLLRCWLTVQKIKEVKERVLDGLAGDVDGDGAVNIFDIFMLAEAWNTQVGDPAYHRACDLDDDGSVNIFDIFVVAEDWGK